MAIELSFDPNTRIPFRKRLAAFLATNPDPTLCWEWMGSRTKGGYGKVTFIVQGATAYRAAYEIMIGPVPHGLHLDHLCRNPPCFNPSHLEPVTPAENARRAAAARNACPHGHEWTAENTRSIPRSDGKPGFVRWCNECGRIRGRDYWRRKGAKAHRPLDSTICANGHDLTIVGMHPARRNGHRPECRECCRMYSQRARDKRKQSP